MGALTLLLGAMAEPSTDALATTRDVADRVGLAVDNVRLFTEQRQVAETLQRSLLTAPFEHPSAQIAARYVPAAEVARVGGDWHDAFLQPSGSTMLVIGDVVGHDTEAAAAMGQLRALCAGSPCTATRARPRCCAASTRRWTSCELGTFATAGIARFEQTPDEARRGITRMRWSSAGHPAPVVIGPDGGLAPPDAWGGELLLGVDAGASRERDRHAARGRLDGAAVHRRPRRAPGTAISTRGWPGCVRPLADLGSLPLQDLCDELVQRLVDGRPEDDVALSGHPADRTAGLAAAVSRRTRGPAARSPRRPPEQRAGQRVVPGSQALPRRRDEQLVEARAAEGAGGDLRRGHLDDRVERPSGV